MPDAQQSPAKPKQHESKDVKFQEVEERLAAAPLGMQGVVEDFRFRIEWA